MEMYRHTYAEIDLDALAFNVRSLRSRLPERFFCPMVKANAYGHGDLVVAQALEKIGIKHLGVCLIEEALLLRDFGIRCEILVFRGFDREGARKIVERGITPVVSSWEQIRDLEEFAQGPLDVHLKFNTGMNRLGFAAEEAPRLLAHFCDHERLKVRAVLTHLVCGEDADSEAGDSAAQLRAMDGICAVFEPLKPFVHALNSAGIAHYIARPTPAGHPLKLRDWGYRPGLMIYGYNPIREGYGCELKPVMTLRSQATAYREVAAGQGVSYNKTWIAPRTSKIAVVPIGYADGYHRLLSNRADALFNGGRVPVVGSVCMDFLMLDVTGHETSDPTEEVVLFGRDRHDQLIAATELARHAQTIPWEILTSVGERVPRLYVGELARELQVAKGAR